ncbi:MAG: hypothetical protein FWD19_02750 [Defluviitaleaceae bacterium]|nr:hypothetical protein [Defluviitaleaceae bacterium]
MENLYDIIFFGYFIALIILSVSLIIIFLKCEEKIFCNMLKIFAIFFAVGIFFIFPLLFFLNTGCAVAEGPLLVLLIVNVDMINFTLFALVAGKISGGFCKKLKNCTIVPFISMFFVVAMFFVFYFIGIFIVPMICVLISTCVMLIHAFKFAREKREQIWLVVSFIFPPAGIIFLLTNND